MTKRKHPRKIILLHPSRSSICFDVFTSLKRLPKWVSECLYDCPECLYVKDFLKKNPEYRYIGSEDFEHIPSVNRGNLKYLGRLIDELRFKIIVSTKHET